MDSSSPPRRTVHIYVDGSFHPDEGGGYGWVAFSKDRQHIIETESQPVYNSKLQTSTAAELIAALRAAKWAEKQGYNHINIHHDYNGVSRYAIRDAKGNNHLHQTYRDYFRYRVGKNMQTAPVKVYFHEVKSHSGVIRNEMADFLAKGGRRKRLRRGVLAFLKRQWGSLIWSQHLRHHQFPKSTSNS
jgi:ribonuclease HI